MGMAGKQNFTAKDLGIETIDFSSTRMNFEGLTIPENVRTEMANQLDSITSGMKLSPEMTK